MTRDMSVFDTSLEVILPSVESIIDRIPKILAPLFDRVRPLINNPDAGSVLDGVLYNDGTLKIFKSVQKNLDRLFRGSM